MISLAEAQAKLLTHAKIGLTETVALVDATGRYALKDIKARRTQPATDLSAMDGYAIASGHHAFSWRVIGESAAGKAYASTVAAGETARIFTGAPMPAGTDTVILQEDVERNGNVITCKTHFAPGQHVRHKGGVFTQEDTVIAAGEALTPARIALLAMAGYRDVEVARPVTVALLSTGNELVPPGEPTEIDQIPASNDVMLSALLAHPGVKFLPSQLVPDSLPATIAAIERAKAADILITIGGASVGDHDLVHAAFNALGAELDFWKVAVKPGKPLIAGKLGDQIILGLPGNPVSAYVTALLFARPLIAAMLGSARPVRAPRRAYLATELPDNGPRTDHIRAYEDKEGVHPVGLNDSAALTALASAHCLIVRPPYASAAKTGDTINVLDID